jgi:hypothetical protein
VTLSADAMSPDVHRCQVRGWSAVAEACTATASSSRSSGTPAQLSHHDFFAGTPPLAASAVNPRLHALAHGSFRGPRRANESDELLQHDGSSHRGQAAIERLTEQYPTAIMVHSPVRGSWLNQIEIYFSIFPLRE